MISSLCNLKCSEQFFSLVIELGKGLAIISDGLLVDLWILFWQGLGIQGLREGITPHDSLSLSLSLWKCSLLVKARGSGVRLLRLGSECLSLAVV